VRCAVASKVPTSYHANNPANVVPVSDAGLAESAEPRSLTKPTALGEAADQIPKKLNSGKSARQPAAAEAQAHRSAMQTSLPEMAAYLQEVLGQRLTAHMADVSDPQTVSRWIKGNRKPRPDSEQRIVASYQVFQLLLSAETPQTIRAWFLGLNPQLDDSSPAQAIREGQFTQTMGAARAFLVSG